MVATLDAARNLADPEARVIIFDTLMCKGVPFLGTRKIMHFVRVEPNEWAEALVALARTDKRIVGLSADLAKHTNLHIFANHRLHPAL